jgi:hypothetical protein
MNFGVAQEVHAFLARSELDGILGLGFAPYVSHNLLDFSLMILTLVISTNKATSHLTEPRVS